MNDGSGIGSGPPRPTGTVAFLFTDIEGSTEAWATDPAAMSAAVARLEELLDVAAVGGRRAVEQGAGDSAVLAFERASDAAVAAVAAQRAIGAEVWPTPEPLRVRMALHLGEVEVTRDGAYRGTTMNRCGRLLGTAHGGQVVASGSFVAIAGESEPTPGAGTDTISWLDLGTHRLRDIEVPMRIWQLTHPDLDAEHPPLRTPEGQGLHLPGTTSGLVGRRGELARLQELVGAERVVTLVGMGGSGKTRLAIEVAHAALDRGGVLDVEEVGWVDLAKVTDPAALDALVVSELALHHGSGNLRRRIVDHLRARRALVVLDNCEHVLAATAGLVEDLVAGTAEVRVLATSREPLEVGGEAIVRLGPLGLPADPEGADLLDSDAGALFVDRVARVRGNVELEGEDRAAAAEICRRLDGVPLALELAAARARSLPLPVVAERLEQRFALLMGGAGTAHARQRTLEASVAWSYDLLEEAEQTALCHLSTFAGPFDLAAAGAVMAVDGADPVDMVAALVDRSLLAEESRGSDPRYRMLETVRYYARDRNVQSGDATACRERHLTWVRSVIEGDGTVDRFEGPDAADAVRAVDEIADEVRAAMDWALSSGRALDTLAIAAALGWYWVWRGLAAEGGRWLERAEAALTAAGVDVDPGLAARAGFAWQQVATHRFQSHEEVERVSATAIAAAVEAGDRSVEARLRLMLGTHHSFRDPVGNRAEVEAAAELCREHGGPFWAVMADGHLAQSAMFRTQTREAIGPTEAAERGARALGHHQLAAESITRRCDIAASLGDYDGALAAMDDLDRALDGVSMRENRSIAVRATELVRLQRGDVDGVITRMRLAIDEYMRDEDLQFVPLLAGVLGDALVAAGRPDEAVEVLEPIWVLPEIRAARVYALMLDVPLMTALWAAGSHDRAREVAASSASVAEVIGSEMLAARVQVVVAGFDLDSGSPASAEGPLHEALGVLADLGHRQLVCDALEEVARLELDFGRPAAAAVMLGGSLAERDAQQVVLRPARQATYETTLARVREELGDEEAEARFASGRALPLDDVVALAQRGRGERTRPTFGWDGLTETERRVAELVAEGLTNPQIAERLVVGRETVKSHVASVLRKLDVANRVELATFVKTKAKYRS
ncbi:MAG: hypothetical protein KF906_08660 [Actinobacteria bacterium]|nr:hypothetical protein [Actinomycetota bacterium]